MLEGNFQGLTRPPDRKSAATIDRMPAHRMVAGGHPEVSSLTVGMHHPRGRRGVRNRAGHTFLFQARETRVRAPSPLPVMPDLFRHPPRGRGQAAGWIPACAGMTEQRANHRIEGSDYGDTILNSAECLRPELPGADANRTADHHLSYAVGSVNARTSLGPVWPAGAIPRAGSCVAGWSPIPSHRGAGVPAPTRQPPHPRPRARRVPG